MIDALVRTPRHATLSSATDSTPGSSTVDVEPRPGSLSTRTLPPCAARH